MPVARTLTFVRGERKILMLGEVSSYAENWSFFFYFHDCMHAYICVCSRKNHLCLNFFRVTLVKSLCKEVVSCEV